MDRKWCTEGEAMGSCLLQYPHFYIWPFHLFIQSVGVRCPDSRAHLHSAHDVFTLTLFRSVSASQSIKFLIFLHLVVTFHRAEVKRTLQDILAYLNGNVLGETSRALCSMFVEMYEAAQNHACCMGWWIWIFLCMNFSYLDPTPT